MALNQKVVDKFFVFYPDPSSKATLWMKAQHEGALPPPGIVRKDPLPIAMRMET